MERIMDWVFHDVHPEMEQAAGGTLDLVFKGKFQRISHTRTSGVAQPPGSVHISWKLKNGKVLEPVKLGHSEDLQC